MERRTTDKIKYTITNPPLLVRPYEEYNNAFSGYGLTINRHIPTDVWVEYLCNDKETRRNSALSVSALRPTAVHPQRFCCNTGGLLDPRLISSGSSEGIIYKALFYFTVALTCIYGTRPPL